MSEANGNGPLRPEDDLAALAALDLALDELAAGDVAASPIEGEAGVLAAVAAELRAAVPPPPPGAAERGRAAFLASAAELQGEPATGELPRPAPASPVGGRRRRRLPVRVLALAAALVVLAAVPAVARQARPGTALWTVRQAGQELRASLADDPVRRAHLRLNTAADYLAAGTRAGEERREDMADRAEELIDEALDQLDDAPGGARAAVERARAERLLLEVRALERQDDPGGGPGSGSGPGSGEDRSGRGGSGGDSGSSGGDDRSGGGGGGDDDGRSGSGSGSGSGSSGSSGAGRD